jgi:hypothetical protein
LLNMTQRYVDGLKPTIGPDAETTTVARLARELEPVLGRQSLVRGPL